MALLKLLALDEKDLEVISAQMQDAILRVEDMVWEPGAGRFVALMNRFDWQSSESGPYERARCSLRFDHVKAVQLKKIDPRKRAQVLELLTISFEAGEAPAGIIELIFADHCAIRLDVECIEAELSDLGPGWQVRSKPQHGSEQEG